MILGGPRWLVCEGLVCAFVLAPDVAKVAVSFAFLGFLILANIVLWGLCECVGCCLIPCALCVIGVLFYCTETLELCGCSRCLWLLGVRRWDYNSGLGVRRSDWRDRSYFFLGVQMSD